MIWVGTRIIYGREDFVIPLKIDDLASDETTIELTRLNSIDFRGGWVGGLAKLLEKLEKDGVPFHSPPYLGEVFGVAVGATGADFGAAADGIPFRVGLLDFGNIRSLFYFLIGG